MIFESWCLFSGLDPRVLECSLRAALNLLGYNQSHATLATLMADPSLTTVLNSTLEALKPDSCSPADKKSAPAGNNVWEQIKNFLSAFTDNPAGASLSVAVVVIAAVTVYILLKYIHHRVQNLPMRAARVWEFAQTMRNFMERLLPRSDSDLQVDDLAGSAVPDPDVIVALERGTGPPAGDPQTDYYSPADNSDSEVYTTPCDAVRPQSSARRYKDESATPRGRPGRSGNIGSLRSARLYEPSAPPASTLSSTTPSVSQAGGWRQPVPPALDSTDEEVLKLSGYFFNILG